MRVGRPLLPFLLLLAAAPAPAQEPDLGELVATITPSEIMEHIAFLAAPERGGRATPSPGLEAAQEYVVQELQALGLEPAGEEGSFFLPYPVESLVGEQSRIRVHLPETGIPPPTWEYHRDFEALPGSPEGKVRGGVVFAGWAAQARSEHWEDLRGKSVRGKIVFAFTREPYADRPRSRRFAGTRETRWTSPAEKARAVAEAGGVALVLVPDPGIDPVGEFPIPGVAPLPLSQGGGPFLERLRGRRGGFAVPVWSFSRSAASSLFGQDLGAWAAALEKRGKPRVLAGPKDLDLDLDLQWKVESRLQRNVGAFLRGSDGDGEVLVLGAHLDHVGWGLPGASFGRGEFAIHPGADDNASGSAALLEVAEAFAGTRPREDILFLWFSGEELGLLGSEGYCEAPRVPLERTIGMLNMDQIGRTDPRKISVGGLWDRPDWAKLLLRAAKRIHTHSKIDLESGKDLFRRSDQWSFVTQGVPGVFFFEGDLAKNPVYHRPGDVPSTMTGEKSAAVARLLAAFAYELAYEGEGR